MEQSATAPPSIPTSLIYWPRASNASTSPSTGLSVTLTKPYHYPLSLSLSSSPLVRPSFTSLLSSMYGAFLGSCCWRLQRGTSSKQDPVLMHHTIILSRVLRPAQLSSIFFFILTGQGRRPALYKLPLTCLDRSMQPAQPATPSQVSSPPLACATKCPGNLHLTLFNSTATYYFLPRYTRVQIDQSILDLTHLHPLLCPAAAVVYTTRVARCS